MYCQLLEWFKKLLLLRKTSGLLHSLMLQYSATCEGGFKICTVFCLDEDGVISFNCSDQAPPSYEICNQVDCTTGGEKISQYLQCMKLIFGASIN